MFAAKQERNQKEANNEGTATSICNDEEETPPHKSGERASGVRGCRMQGAGEAADAPLVRRARCLTRLLLILKSVRNLLGGVCPSGSCVSQAANSLSGLEYALVE